MIYKKIVDIPLYNGKLMILLVDNLEDIQKHTEIPERLQYGWEDPKRIYAHHVFGQRKGHECYHIILNPNHDVKLTPGAISHECLHFVTLLCRERGIHLDHDNDEPMTYLLEWAVNTVHGFLKKKKIEI